MRFPGPNGETAAKIVRGFFPIHNDLENAGYSITIVRPHFADDDPIGWNLSTAREGFRGSLSLSG
jgi:hypothetical protein